MAWEHKELALRAYTSSEALEAFDELGLGGSGHRVIPVCYTAVELRVLREPFNKLLHSKQYFNPPYFVRYSTDIKFNNKHYLIFPLWAIEKDIRILKKFNIDFNLEKSLGYLSNEAVSVVEDNTYFGCASISKVTKKMHLLNKVVFDDKLVFMKYTWEK